MKHLILILTVLLLASCNIKTNKQYQGNVDYSEVKNDVTVLDTIDRNEVKNEYQNSLISPAINMTIEKDKNSIYCSSFEISWNKIRDEILNGHIQFSKSVAWVDFLNEQPKNNSISSEYVSSIVGFGKDDILTKIKSELKKKFNYDYNPEYVLKETDILAVAYLKKEIRFYSQLNEYFEGEKLLFNDSVNVLFFGLKHGWTNPTYKSKLRIHDYINKDDFIFQIGTKAGKDEIYFAKINPESTLEKTYQKVMKRVKKGNLELLGNDEQVRIPYIKFSIKNEFQEVEGAKILNKGYETYFIGKAVQIIDFDLNETGITLESTAESDMLECISEQEPKKLIFDKPFLIVLKETNKKNPYFLMWVNNAKFMNVKE